MTGIAGVIAPAVNLSSDLLMRDWLAMFSLTLCLLVFAYGYRRTGRINRVEGVGLLLVYCAYNTWLLFSVSN